MAKVVQNIFNRKKLYSILNNITPESFAGYTQIPDIKNKIDNWCRLIQSKTLDGKNEISLQDSFLSDIFGKILDYKFIHESPEEWHLYREKKTVTDSTRSDGALGFFTPKNEDVRVVIELKDAKTSLDAKQKRKGANYTPVEQAFLYSGKFSKKCRWIIVSNYKEIRLYNRSASMNECETFFVENLKDEYELKRFLYLLSRKNLIEKKKDSVIDRLYSSNEAEQEKISKEFYNKYKSLRLHIFEHLKQENSGYDDLILLEKTQKMLDRFIFVCYCEDFGLLPERIFRKMMEAVSNPMMFANVTRWDQLKNLFRAIDQGSPPHNINKFNGGLFEFDEILDGGLVIGDEIFDELARITDYDFDSELNVNVLGHIFEQSITDIEEIKSAIAGDSFDKKKGKRKKDGIFYTPEYITRYIVEQAVGGWLEDRKKDLGFEKLPELTEKDFASIKYYKKTGAIRSSNKNIKDHLAFWQAYKEKLSDIKVLDPACGSGAFLNQAFDFLYKEGQHVNEQIARLQKGQIEVFRLDEHILKNNLFGVDLNPESVEITKLSLWLKTADRNSQLTALDDNIKCGNSLIDDPEIAGKRAFKWEDEFSEIIENGGFDVVVGNPPYFNVQTFGVSSPYTTYLQIEYSDIWMDKSDILFYFIKKAIELSKSEICFIISNAFLFSDKARKLRNYILENTSFIKIINFEQLMIFQDASITSAIIHLNKVARNDATKVISLKNKSYSNENVYEIISDEKNSINVTFKKNNVFALIDDKTALLNQKIDSKGKKIGDLFKVGKGMETAADNIFTFKEYPSIFPSEFIKKRVTGLNTDRYYIYDDAEHILYFEDVEKFDDLPKSIRNYLLKNKIILEKRATVKNEGRI